MNRISHRVLVVLAIAGILVIALFLASRRKGSTRALAAGADLEVLASAWSGYLQANGSVPVHTVLPGKLQACLPAGISIPLVDPWGHPYQWRRSGAAVEVLSTGLDGILDTDDDLTERVSQP